MRALTLLVLATFAVVPPAAAQLPPVAGNPAKVPAPKPPPDESRLIVKEIEEAYKAPLEVDEDVRDELRKQYKNPTPEREAKLFYEIRRLYSTTAASEEAILREVRRAYLQPTPQQEERVFAEIRRNEHLPLGMVHPAIRSDQATKLFRRLDQDGNGRLGPDEMTDSLRGVRARWDRDRDGFIDGREYEAFFLSHHETVAEAVASGEIPLRLPKGVAGPGATPSAAVERKVVGKYPPGLPAWFAEYDMDKDGMVGLYEWRRKGRPSAEFVSMDRNDDCYLTARELLFYLAEQSRPRPNPPPADPPAPGP